MEVFDVMGRRVRIAPNARFSAGPHVIEWDGRADGGTRLRGWHLLVRLYGSGFDSVSRWFISSSPTPSDQPWVASDGAACRVSARWRSKGMSICSLRVLRCDDVGFPHASPSRLVPRAPA
jgi:hypothetical protein